MIAAPACRRAPLARLALAALLALGLVAVAAPAAMAETYVESTPMTCSASSWGSGGTDQTGTVYVSCNNLVYRATNSGTVLPTVTLPSSTTDVAPSPDGKYIYFFNGDNPARMNRQADGTYKLDATWKVQTFNADGKTWSVNAQSIAVDAWGDLYFSNGGWYVAPSVILKYHPDGTLVTQFGTWGYGVGEFRTNMGITVSRDGRTIYTTENESGRVQRFDYVNGTYKYTTTWGNNGDTTCSTNNNFSAPYDAAVDPWGYLYIMDTSCQRVLKFSPTSQPLGEVVHFPAPNPGPRLAHGVTVDYHGNVYIGAWGKKFVRGNGNTEPGPAPTPQPLPAPDTTAPVLSAVTVPATTTTQTISVGITASDNVAVDKVKLTAEDGTTTTGWVAYAPTVNFTLTAGYGYKGVLVQVKDAADNVSGTIYKTLTYQAAPPPPADTVAPVLGSVTVPANTTTQAITVATTATDDTGVTMMRLANEDGTWSAWQPYAASVQWSLTPGYGTKGVTVQVKDAADNLSNTIYKTLSYAAAPPPPADAADPILVSATIPATTTSQTVTVALDATDDRGVTQVRFANEDGNWGAWQAYAASKDWTLTAGYTYKLVVAQVRDAAGRESNTIVMKTQLVKDAPIGPPPPAPDNEAPVLNKVTVPATSTTQQVGIALDATDNTGVAQMRFANEDGMWGPWTDYNANTTWMLSAGYTLKLVVAQVRDAAGNESNTIISKTQWVLNQPPAGPVDAADPVLTSLVIPSPATTQTITVTLDATDDIGVTQVRFANEDGNWTAWQDYAPSKQWTLSAGNNLYKLVFAQVRDASGKESNVIYKQTLLQMP